MNVADLIRAAQSGSTRATGRLLSLIEGDRRDEVLAALDTASARVVGITGPPGAGKSTTIAVLVGGYRERGMRVAVLAVDPSSPYSGGAILGDRIRMAAHIDDPDVFIRSIATRGHLGGLAAAVPAAIQLLAALSYDLIVLETVGVGQSEIEIAAVADPTIVILNPVRVTQSKPRRQACSKWLTLWSSIRPTATVRGKPPAICGPRHRPQSSHSLQPAPKALPT